MDLNYIFLTSELIILWVTAVIAIWEFKWAKEDRKAKKAVLMAKLKMVEKKK